MVNQQLSTNTFTTAKWIVSANAAQGTHTTIAGALTAASSGDTIFIFPGTYTEDPTLKAGVDLVTYEADGYTPNVVIIGKCTATFAGTCTLSGIELQTNSDFCLSITGTNATAITLVNCYINATNNTAINMSSSNNSSDIKLFYCTGNLTTTGIAYFSVTNGSLRVLHCSMFNDFSSSTASTLANNSVCEIYNSLFYDSITTSNSSSLGIILSDVYLPNAGVTINGTGSNIIDLSRVESGTASAVSVGAGAICTISNTTINSSNANAITGAGQVNIAPTSFTGTSSNVNTTTTVIENIGPVLKNPQQPCFLALANAVSNVTGNGTAYTVTFTTSFDQASNFSGTTTFTAPVTGRYYLTTSIQVTGLSAAMTVGELDIVTTGGTFSNINAGGLGRNNNNQATFNMNIVCAMTAGDTAHINLQIFNGAATASVLAGSFSGYMVC